MFGLLEGQSAGLKHKPGKVVSIVDERAEKQRQVIVTQNGYKKRIQEKEDEHQELIESVASLKHSAQTAVEDTERMFRGLIQSIERKSSQMTELIRAQEKTELSRAEKHLKQVEQEIVDLKRKDDELQQLSQTEDDFCYLQIFQSYQGLKLTEDFSRIKINMLQSCEDIKISVNKLKQQVDSIKQHPDSSSQLKGPALHFSEKERDSLCEEGTQTEISRIRQHNTSKSVLSSTLRYQLQGVAALWL
ncbi:hypothetical protein MHYP_G00056000 [Metynnis hypsauchen]